MTLVSLGAWPVKRLEKYKDVSGSCMTATGESGSRVEEGCGTARSFGGLLFWEVQVLRDLTL